MEAMRTNVFGGDDEAGFVVFRRALKRSRIVVFFRSVSSGKAW